MTLAGNRLPGDLASVAQPIYQGCLVLFIPNIRI
jgi:hypothetical protein